MRTATFKQRMLAGEMLAGTFMKTPSHDMIELMALAGLDFVCIDVEHSPFDRKSMDACLAVARALDFPTLVRVGSGTPQNILQALDSGAVGVVVPHVTSAEKAAEVARSAHFGLGGRGFAGSTRWAGYATRPMSEILDQSRAETVVIAQIEEPEGVDAAGAIAATDGIDALFVGPADLSVSYGKTDTNSDELLAAFASVSKDAKNHGKAMITFVPNVEKAQELRKFGISVFFVASDHAWAMQGARAVGEGVRGLK